MLNHNYDQDSANTRATVPLPNAANNAVMEEGRALAGGEGYKHIGRDGSDVMVEFGAWSL